MHFLWFGWCCPTCGQLEISWNFQVQNLLLVKSTVSWELSAGHMFNFFASYEPWQGRLHFGNGDLVFLPAHVGVSVLFLGFWAVCLEVGWNLPLGCYFQARMQESFYRHFCGSRESFDMYSMIQLSSQSGLGHTYAFSQLIVQSIVLLCRSAARGIIFNTLSLMGTLFPISSISKSVCTSNACIKLWWEEYFCSRQWTRANETTP